MLIDKICGFDLYDDIKDIKRAYPPQKMTNRGIDYTNVRYEKIFINT